MKNDLWYQNFPSVYIVVLEIKSPWGKRPFYRPSRSHSSNSCGQKGHYRGAFWVDLALFQELPTLPSEKKSTNDALFIGRNFFVLNTYCIHTEYIATPTEYSWFHRTALYIRLPINFFRAFLYSAVFRGGCDVFSVYSVCIQYVFRTKKFRPMKRASLVLFFSLGTVGSTWNNAKSTQKAPL